MIKSLRALNRLISNISDKRLLSFGINIDQLIILLYLNDEQAEKSITEMSGNLLMNRSTLSRSFLSLLKKDLVQQDFNKEKKSSKNTVISDKGRRVVEKTTPIFKALSKKTEDLVEKGWMFDTCWHEFHEKKENLN